MSKINTLQGLRVIAFLAIFAWHLNGYMGIKVINFAAIAVTFFFMLSGFFSMLTLEKKITKDNILKQSLNYAKNKMKKIYPLYLATVLLYTPLSIKNLILEQDMSLIIYLIMILVNVILLESFLLKNTIDISYVGWYLSNLFLLNLVTIPIYKIINKFNKSKNILKTIFCIIFTFLFLYIYSKFVPEENKGYYFYYFPLFRVFEYFIGMCIANIYIKTKNLIIENKNNLFSLLEMLTILIICLLINKTIKLNYGFLNSFINILISMLAIIVFMYQKGIVSKFLCLKPLVFMGDISGEMYLIHNVLIAYILGIAKRILPENVVLGLIISIFIFILTIILAYIIHYKKYENMKKNLKTKLIHVLGILKKKKLKCKNFTIISNNCFGGVFYRNNALEYMSPTCGMFIMPKDYIKFIYNLKEYLNLELKEIKLEESNYKEYLEEIKYPGTIGKLNDIEIMFLHYKSFDEAKQKWERRAKRVNFENIIYKFNDQNNCTYDELLKFEEFDAENKLCFTAKKYDNINSIIFSEFEKDGYILNDSKEKIYKRYIDMYKYINERFGVNEKN